VGVRIAVAGATGVVGRYVVEEVRRTGHEAVPLARSLDVDVLTGEGLTQALYDVDAVVDVLSTKAMTPGKAADFFETTSANLLQAERAAGVRHHVALSIVGIDRVPSGYYHAKLRQEGVVAEGPVPWTILRATQFHEFAQQRLDLFTDKLFAFVPSMLTQPIAAEEVAEALVAYATGSPAGRTPDLAGPEQRQLVPMARTIARARKRWQLVLPLHVPGVAGRAFREGALLPEADGPRGRETFDEWFARNSRRATEEG
jgi:uncharacterized protein YbjT (DUF2867 family)